MALVQELFEITLSEIRYSNKKNPLIHVNSENFPVEIPFNNKAFFV